MRVFIAFIALSALLVASCNREHAGEIKKVDSLYTEVETMEDTLAKIDIARVRSMIDENTKLVNRVQEEYKDTLTKEQMFFFYDYKRYRKSLVQMVENYEFQVEQLAYSKTQLENLKEDVENGLIVDEHFRDYYSSEKDAITRLKEASDNMKVWYSNTFKRYNELKKGVEDILADSAGSGNS